MTREEVLQRGVQKWHCLSKSERSIYYVMAGRFMEFEAEEARQCQNAQWMKAAQGVPHPAPLRPVPRAPSAPERGQKRARIREKASAGAQSANAQPPRCRQSPHTEAPTEVPLEAVAEGLEITEGLLGPSGPTQGLPGEERGEDSSKPPQGEEGVYPDPGLLTYINELCAQGDFLNKADAVLHPRFLAELPCPEAQLDLLALAEELEQEEGLSLAQSVLGPYILGLFTFKLALPEWDPEQLVEEASLSSWTRFSMWNGQAAAVRSQPVGMTSGGGEHFSPFQKHWTTLLLIGRLEPDGRTPLLENGGAQIPSLQLEGNSTVSFRPMKKADLGPHKGSQGLPP
ncbi:Nut Family Member 2E [Manis pentadactyla]|nr:Nut Family Member 2E [Manis pentadactyla]